MLVHFCPGAQSCVTVHWDLLIESPGAVDDPALAAWQVSIPPNDFNMSRPMAVRRLPDHRRIYLSYEGTISGERGHCRVIDGGSCDVIRADADLWQVRFAGQQLTGLYTLRKSSDDIGWTLAKNVG